jgi:hypothetical protein
MFYRKTNGIGARRASRQSALQPRGKSGRLRFLLRANTHRPGYVAVVEGGIAEQTERAILNLKAVLEASGSSLGRRR